MQNNRSKGIIVAIVVVALILVISGIAFSGILTGSTGGTSTSTTSQSTSRTTSTTTTTSHSSSSSTISALNQTQSGLVVSDPLTSGNVSAWTVSGFSSGGSALCSPSENSSGLCLEVQPQNSGEWAGNFAAQGVGNASVYHANLTVPFSTITSSNASFNMGLYVKPLLRYGQPAGAPVNYVACGVSVTSGGSGGYVWQVVYGTGNLSGASSTKVLYYTYNSPSLSQACTIITNGANFLTVYLGTNMVYSNSSMNLQISTPFSAYLEVGAINTTSQMLQGEFSNFYATLNDSISVTNAPAGGTVKIVDSSNSTIASAPVGSNGVAKIPVTPYAEPLNAYIRVYDSTGKLVATTSSLRALWGGDTYSVG